MRFCCSMMMLIGLLNSGYAQLPAAPAKMTGAQLFDHEWRYPNTEGAARIELVEQDSRDDQTDEVFEKAGSLTNGLHFRTNRLDKVTWVRNYDQLIHVPRSCSHCHPNGGAAGLKTNQTLLTIDPRSDAVLNATQDSLERLRAISSSTKKMRSSGIRFVNLVHDFKTITNDGFLRLPNQSVTFAPEVIPIPWYSTYSHDSRKCVAIAETPVIAGRIQDVDFYLSQRSPAPLHGLGLIDQISEDRIRSLAELQASDSNKKITGRFVGKFGWRGQGESVRSFLLDTIVFAPSLAHAYDHRSIRNSVPAIPPDELEVDNTTIPRIVDFVRQLPPPIEVSPPDHKFSQDLTGENLFIQVGCADCHVPDVPPALNVFSDFLLHDMGERLQSPSPAPMGDAIVANTTIWDSFPPSMAKFPAAESIAKPASPQFPRGPRPTPVELARPATASVAKKKPTGMTWDDMQREWKTPALWGIADSAPYLHDGRAGTLDDAIRWHGGEAQESHDAYAALQPEERSLVLVFLSSLRAPTSSPLLDSAKED